HEALREPTARLVGANSLEVICMNSLTVNLHLMMATFYRPTKSRFKILMEDPAFPSDTYAIKTQIVHHGLDPNDALILARPRKGEFTIGTEDIVDLINKHVIALTTGAIVPPTTDPGCLENPQPADSRECVVACPATNLCPRRGDCPAPLQTYKTTLLF